MKKLAIAFSSKDRVELSRQTFPRVVAEGADVFWNDGSATAEGQRVHQTGFFDADYSTNYSEHRTRVTGGPDRAIVFALSQMLADKAYSHVGLLENDVLLDPDWLEPTMDLFKYSVTEGLPIGAVSARCYEDRILIQRDGYAVCHNAGAGHVIFTREAAEIVLANYRTGWWSENRATFSQISGIDIGKFAAFGFNEQMITADWSWDTILAAHGLATVALTPSKAAMIGQDMPLEQQGLRLVTSDPLTQPWTTDDTAFERFRRNLIDIHSGKLMMPTVDHNLQTRNGTLIFPHHAVKHGGAFTGNWTTKWSQGFGPFVYVAGAGASFTMPIFGACAFHVSSGRVSVRDEATGFSNEVDLTGTNEVVTVSVPREFQTGPIRLEFGVGACLHGIETLHSQPEWKNRPFDYSMLPEVG